MIKILNSLNQKYRTNYNKQDLKYPVIKISILTLIASISSLLTHIISILSETETLFFIDIVINCLCLMLMTSYYPNIYKNLCCLMIKCILSCDEQQNKIQIHIDQNKKNNESIHNNNNDDDTKYDVRTLELSPEEIKYEQHSEYTKTIYTQQTNNVV